MQVPKQNHGVPMWLDAVLPLTVRDLARAELLLESLARNFSGLRRLWVVCPDIQRDVIAARLVATLPFELCIEPESAVVPEFALKLRQTGWFRQQLIKLAIHERIESDFYLTLDADVVCARPVRAEQLVTEGKAGCFLIRHHAQDYWYERVERVLRVTAPRRGITHNVTPALLSRQGVQALRDALTEQIRRGRYSRGWRGWKQRWALWQSRGDASYQPWRVFLVAARPWTEYALYYTFLETSGLFERYHYYASDCIYSLEHSLWHASGQQLPATWEPAQVFEGEGPPWFLVAQSNTGISPQAIRGKLEPLLHRRSDAATT